MGLGGAGGGSAGMGGSPGTGGGGMAGMGGTAGAGGGTSADWWAKGWQRRVKISFRNANGKPLTNFPVMVRLDELRAEGILTLSSGTDLRFFDADGTALPHEIDVWKKGEQSFVWVKVPTIDVSDSDHIWLYYGNSKTIDAQNAPSVWTSFTVVYHMSDSTAVKPIVDSLGAHPGAWSTGSLSTIVTGQIGEAVYFNQNQFIKIGSSSLVAVNTNEARTIEAWVKSTYDKQDQEIVWQESQCIGWHLGTTMAGNFWGSFVVNSTMNYCTAQTDANVESTSALDWRYLALVIDRPKGSMSLYVDGQVTKTTPIDNTGYADGSGDFTIGAEYGGAKSFLGNIDEVRISDHARAPAWIEAQYRSMRDDFLTFAPFEVP